DEWMMETELLDGNGPVARTELEDKLNTVVRFNQFFKVPLGGGNFAYWRHNPQTDQVELINDLMSPITFNKHEFGKGVLGVKPRDHEQYLLMQYGLMNEAIDTVFIHGKAGSGKTFPTTACALASTLRTSGNILNNMLPMDGSVPKHLHDIYRNMRVVGGAYDRLMFYKGGFGDSSVGFLPGGYEEKTIPSLTNFDKAMERIPFCRDTHMTLADLLEDPTKVDPKKGPKPKEKHDRDFRLPADCALVDYLNWDHVRGATLSRVFLICDEMQNSTDTLAKTILTRTADRSKRVIMADTRQIDRRGNTPDQNGFMASLYFSLSQNGGRGLPGTMFIDLTRGYRDASADVFADMPTYQ
ncbi:MAG TPA: PhoH family protein, partial [Acidobacteriota bacterium]|nr:PhoH family protein [Acidobacteriota bacterium]